MPSQISIVTPSYNQGKYIRQTLDSILNQDYPSIQAIVMDGGSQDETVEILQSYNDPRLVWRSEPDKGQSQALNKGMQLVTGDIVAYLNSDDVYLPGVFSFVDDYFYQHPEVDVVYGHCLAIDGAGKELALPLNAAPFDLRAALTKRWKIWQPGVFWRRRVMEKIGLFDETLHYTMDFDYWLRMVVAGFIPQSVDQHLASFRLHDESKSVSQLLSFKDELKSVFDKLYTRADLTEEIRRYKPFSYAYVEFYQADAFWKQKQRKAARPYLQRVIAGNGPARLRVMALAMLIDSYGVTSFSKSLQKAYSHFKG